MFVCCSALLTFRKPEQNSSLLLKYIFNSNRFEDLKNIKNNASLEIKTPFNGRLVPDNISFLIP
jgi:hypothetical protein